MTSVRFNPNVVASAVRVVARPHKASTAPHVTVTQGSIRLRDSWIGVVRRRVFTSNATQTPAQKDGYGGNGQKGQVQLNGEIVEAHGSLQKKTCGWTFGEVRAALAAVFGVRCKKNNRFCPCLGPNVTAETRAVNFTYLAGDHA